MLDTKTYSYFCDEGYEVLADLSDWRHLTTRQLADVARRFAIGMEVFTEPDKQQPADTRWYMQPTFRAQTEHPGRHVPRFTVPVR